MLSSGAQFRDMFKSFHATNRSLKTLVPRNCSVSTMTVCGKLDTPLRIDAILEFMRTHDTEGDYGISFNPESITKRPKTFFNQLTIKSASTSIKLFSNGAVHVTGAKSPVHFIDVMDRVCTALAVVVDSSPILDSASISMINAIFSAARLLPLRVLRQAFETAGHSASYDPDAYPGINAKISVPDQRNEITVMIFTTGNIIISGAKTPDHISQVYHIVCHVIDDLNLETNESPRANCSSGILDMYTIVGGYSSRIANLCI